MTIHGELGSDIDAIASGVPSPDHYSLVVTQPKAYQLRNDQGSVPPGCLKPLGEVLRDAS